MHITEKNGIAHGTLSASELWQNGLRASQLNPLSVVTREECFIAARSSVSSNLCSGPSPGDPRFLDFYFPPSHYGIRLLANRHTCFHCSGRRCAHEFASPNEPMIPESLCAERLTSGALNTCRYSFTLGCSISLLFSGLASTSSTSFYGFAAGSRQTCAREHRLV